MAELVEAEYRHIDPVRIVLRGMRFYRVPGGLEYPSMTTVLSRTKQDGPALSRWKRTATPEQLAEAKRKMEEGSKRGNLLHDEVENYFLRNEKGYSPWFESIYPELRKVTKAHLIESATWHPRLEVAGTLDLFGEVEGNNEVLDWKTASREKRLDWIEDYLLQVCGYTASMRVHYRRCANRGRVVIAIVEEDEKGIQKVLPAQVVRVSPNLMKKLWPRLKKRRAMFKAMTGE